jgi:CDP-6-deoxy-D-xylo-4-hexulose-3-dehydrase
LGKAGTFSFYVAHNIQAGEMGAITTDDEDTAKIVRKIKAAGRICDCPICTRHQGVCPREGDEHDPRFTHDIIGFNFKTTEFEAALGITQLRRADEITKKRRENVKYLNDALKQHSDVLKLPVYSPDVSYLAYPIVVKKQSRISCRRLRKELEKLGVESRPLFGCIPTQQPAYGFLKKEYMKRLPVAEYLGENAFYVGCHQYLSQEQLEHMVKCFEEILS